MLRFTKRDFGQVAVLATLLLTFGCNKTDVDNAQKQVDDATKAVGDAAEEMKTQLGEGFQAATDKAKAALQDVEGGGEVLDGLKKMFASAEKTIQGISDKASAENASAEIDKLLSNFSGLSQKVEQLPAEAKTAIKGVVKQGIEALKALVDKVMAMPAVKDTVGPKLKELMDKLEGLAGDNS